MPTERALPTWLPRIAVLLALSGALALTPSERADASDACAAGVDPFEILDRGDDESGIGGTGIRASRDVGEPTRSRAGGDDESGIGGTGHAPRSVGIGDGEGDSGIGGTGIYGTVTRRDRLCVNGFEVRVPSELALEGGNAGQNAKSSLEVGQIVWIRAAREDGELVAQRIELQDPADADRLAQILHSLSERGIELEYVSIEGQLSGSADRPRIGGYELDFAHAGGPDRVMTTGLRPGMHVRVGGRMTREGRIEIGLPTRPERPAPGPGPRPPTEIVPESPGERPGSGASSSSGVSPAPPVPQAPRPPSPRPTDVDRPIRPKIDRPTRPPSIDRPRSDVPRVERPTPVRR